MSEYIDLELVLDELLRLYEEDVDRFGVEIPETFDYRRAKEALQSLPVIEASEDCISREWVLNRLSDYIKDFEKNFVDEWQNRVVHWIIGDIEDAPSVVPKRAEGEWIDTQSGDHWKCSVCGHRAPYEALANDKAYEWLSEYCPNCGARLHYRGSEGECF